MQRLKVSKRMRGRKLYQVCPSRILNVTPIASAAADDPIQSPQRMRMFLYLLLPTFFFLSLLTWLLLSPEGTQLAVVPKIRSLMAMRYAYCWMTNTKLTLKLYIWRDHRRKMTME